MDQYSNKQRTELLWDLLANPADKDLQHTQNLQQLVAEYPQSGLLHALLTYGSDGANLQHAAVYFNPKALYKLNKDIDALHPVAESQVLLTNVHAPVTGYFHTDEEVLAPVEEETEPAIVESATPPEAEELPPLLPDANFAVEQQPDTGIFTIDANAPVLSAVEEPVTEEIITAVQPYAEKKITSKAEEDIYDEIVSIDDINLAVQEYYSSVMEPQTADSGILPYADIYAEALKQEEEPTKPIAEAPLEQPEAPNEGTVFKDRKVDLTDEAEKLILNNIAATDFFVFEEALGEKKKPEDIKAEEPPQEALEEPAAPVEETPIEIPAPSVSKEIAVKSAESKPYEPISKYHDEKMPYSFMWWLDKTRKEHSGIYQPFVQFRPDTSQPITPAVPELVQQQPVNDELQQQYIESIFHMNTVEDLENGIVEQPVFDTKKKEDEIIERFIHDVPQIKPQSADKLDNENKARKSSEDRDELVTETLAQIYIDQMIYPKAIDTYKKLMLKFPEKSRYFAARIENLQNK